MNRMDQFIGGGFTWFTGVVEDRFDPLEMNRVKVRCFGFHTENKGTIDVDDLPWATVMLPTTSSGTSGIGDTPHGLMEGSWVVGFFRDGVSAQDPIIMGTIASQNSPRSKALGFTGDHYPLAEYQNESDINFAGRQDKYSASSQYDTRVQGSSPSDIQVAVPPKIPTVSEDKADAYYAETPWKELPPMNGHIPDYPYNKVNQSEAGHVTEIDDTPGNERTHRMHTSGSYEEIYTDGTRQVKIVGDDYEVVFANKNIHIKGNCSMTVDGDLRQMVYGNYHLQVEKDMTMNIKGSLQQKIGGNHEAEIVRSRSTNIGVDDNLSVMNNSTTNIINDKLLTVGNDFTSAITNNMATTVLNNKTVMNAGTFSHTSLADYTLSVNANQIIGVVGSQTTSADTMDIDALTSMTLDSPTGSIDLPAGNITSNNVTLHTHTHTEVPGTGGSASPSPATQPTTAPISGT